MTVDLYTTFDPSSLHALGDDELDALPFGVIALGAGGRIARYNLAEARFARLDRAQVVGRSFFGEIARCTATPEFMGRYERISVDPTPVRVRFEYVFAFRFGAQSVDVDMGSIEGASLVYICINRRKFLPRQKDVPPSVEAPLLAELEPDAEAAGVVRDAHARRRVELDVSFIEALLRTIARADPGRSTRLLRDIGATWARAAIVELETEALEATGRSLAEGSMHDAMEAVSRFIQRQRLGRLTFDFEHAPRGAIALEMTRNVFAEALVSPGCALLEALFSVVFAHVAGRSVHVREITCHANGTAPCTFVCVASERADALAAAGASGGRSIEAIVAAMAEVEGARHV